MPECFGAPGGDAESSRNFKGVSLTRVCPGSRRREGLVWWWKRKETSCALGMPQPLPDTALLGGDRGGNGGGMVTGSTGGYWWLWSGHRQ